jgi:hypothetical protein
VRIDHKTTSFKPGYLRQCRADWDKIGVSVESRIDQGRIDEVIDDLCAVAEVDGWRAHIVLVPLLSLYECLGDMSIIRLLSSLLLFQIGGFLALLVPVVVSLSFDDGTTNGCILETFPSRPCAVRLHESRMSCRIADEPAVVVGDS